MTQNQREGFVIVSRSEGDEDEPLFWSNEDGWGDLESATVFSREELADGCSLPMSVGKDAEWMTWLKARALASPNENVLQGMCCPQCGAYGPFKILATKTGWAHAYDDGTCDFNGDVEWEDNSPCECPACQFSGTVSDFRASALEVEE